MTQYTDKFKRKQNNQLRIEQQNRQESSILQSIDDKISAAFNPQELANVALLNTLEDIEVINVHMEYLNKQKKSLAKQHAAISYGANGTHPLAEYLSGKSNTIVTRALTAGVKSYQNTLNDGGITSTMKIDGIYIRLEIDPLSLANFLDTVNIEDLRDKLKTLRNSLSPDEIQTAHLSYHAYKGPVSPSISNKLTVLDRTFIAANTAERICNRARQLQESPSIG